MKICSECGQGKELDQFHRRSAAPDGRCPQCKECTKPYTKARYQADPEAAKAAARAAYRLDPSGSNERSRFWLARNKEKRAAYRVKYRAENAQKITESRRLWRAKNVEQLRSKRAAYYRRNVDKFLAEAKAWRAVNAQKHSEASAAWAARNLAKRRMYQQSRRSRMLSLWVEDVDLLTVWERDKGICRLCDEPADPEDWHLEHLLPVSRGGEHSYKNTAVSHPRCNLSKKDRTYEEWRSLRAS